MSSWIQRQSNSHYAQLAGAALLSGTAVAGAILGYQAVKRKSAIETLKRSIPQLDENHPAQKVSSPLYSGYATLSL